MSHTQAPEDIANLREPGCRDVVVPMDSLLMRHVCRKHIECFCDGKKIPFGDSLTPYALPGSLIVPEFLFNQSVLRVNAIGAA